MLFRQHDRDVRVLWEKCLPRRALLLLLGLAVPLERLRVQLLELVDRLIYFRGEHLLGFLQLASDNQPAVGDNAVELGLQLLPFFVQLHD